jgi:hypothetical protein
MVWSLETRGLAPNRDVPGFEQLESIFWEEYRLELGLGLLCSKMVLTELTLLCHLRPCMPLPLPPGRATVFPLTLPGRCDHTPVDTDKHFSLSCSATPEEGSP